MSEYVYKHEGDATPEWRRVYVVMIDGNEIGAFFSHEAVEAFYSGFEMLGGNTDDIYTNMYLQPLKSAKWLDESLDLKRPTIDI